MFGIVCFHVKASIVHNLENHFTSIYLSIVLENRIGVNWFYKRPEFIPTALHTVEMTNAIVYLKKRIFVSLLMIKQLIRYSNIYYKECNTGISNNEHQDGNATFFLRTSTHFLYLPRISLTNYVFLTIDIHTFHDKKRKHHQTVLRSMKTWLIKFRDD